MRPLHCCVIKKRVVNGGFGGLCGPAFTAGLAGSHHGFAHFAHHCANISKIKIDQAGLNHQIGDPANALVQYCVGHMEGISECCALIGKPEQILIRNDDQRIDISLQLFDAILSLFHPALAFKFEWFGDHTNGQNTAFAGGPGNNWGGAGTGATAHTGSDKDHVTISQFCHDFCQAFFGGRTANFRL